MSLFAIIGSYTPQQESAPTIFHLEKTNSLMKLRCSGTVEHPSFVTYCLDNNTIYAVSETDRPGSIVALRPKNSQLVEIDRVSTYGNFPCHLSCSNGHLFVTNYGSGEVLRFDILPNGMFGPLSGKVQLEGRGPHERQESSHPHCATPTADGTLLYVCDLGTDEIVIIDNHKTSGADGFSIRQRVPLLPGSGPRHLVLHPTEPIIFVVCELNNSLAVLMHDRSTDNVDHLQTVPLLSPSESASNLAAAIKIHPSGNHIYISNRGHDSISTLIFDPVLQRCRLLSNRPCGGSGPRDFELDPTATRMLVANEHSGTITQLNLDQSTLEPLGAEVIALLERPTSICFFEET